MPVAAKKIVFTYRDLELFEPDNFRHEIIEGEHVMSPSPGVLHQRIVLKIANYLTTHTKETNAGEIFIAPIDVVFHDIDVFVPDIVFISNQNKHIVKEKNIQGSPDLIIEVLSPHSVTRDKEINYKRYAYYNVKEYWIVDPDRNCIEVHDLANMTLINVFSQDETLNTPVFPDLNLKLDSIF